MLERQVVPVTMASGDGDLRVSLRIRINEDETGQ